MLLLVMLWMYVDAYADADVLTDADDLVAAAAGHPTSAILQMWINA